MGKRVKFTQVDVVIPFKDEQSVEYRKKLFSRWNQNKQAFLYQLIDNNALYFQLLEAVSQESYARADGILFLQTD